MIVVRKEIRYGAENGVEISPFRKQRERMGHQAKTIPVWINAFI